MTDDTDEPIWTRTRVPRAELDDGDVDHPIVARTRARDAARASARRQPRE